MPEDEPVLPSFADFERADTPDEALAIVALFVHRLVALPIEIGRDAVAMFRNAGSD